jgi:zinc and cadmium transporter
MKKRMQTTHLTEALLSGLCMSLVSFTGVTLLLLRGLKIEKELLMVSAVILVTDALMHQLPEALELNHSAGSGRVAGLAMLGVLLTVAVQKVAHSHKHPNQALGYANLLNEVIHNFIDGLALGVAWMSGKSAGWSTSFAIAAHEIPQEMGDFAILAAAGFSTKKLLLLNFVVSFTCPVGVVVSYLLGSVVSEGFRELLLPVTAGSFLAFAFFILQPILSSRTDVFKFACVSAAVLAAHAVILDHHHH